MTDIEIDEFINHLSFAMRQNKEEQVIDLLFRISSLKFPTRAGKHNTGGIMQHPLTNGNFLAALRQYRHLRTADNTRYLEHKNKEV